ncbi:hypothetical protein MCHI_003378 [Candidatus Magnetoovum chiemensis]|nr:hypothetical protein MCHI_003378 [Candidatus Magnetoovum chiemensis]
MATINLTSGNAAIPYEGKNKHYRLSNRLDFAANNASSADVIQALLVKANTKVQAVYTKIVTAEGATATATAGDGTDPDGWDTSVNLNAAAATVTQTISTDGYGADGKTYTAEDTIDLTLAADLDACIVYIYADCLDLNE